MPTSIEPELRQLRDQLGGSPIDPVFAGLHHIRYMVAPGAAVPFIHEWGKKTRYHFAGAFRRTADQSIQYVLRLEDNPIAMIVEESNSLPQGFPRLRSLGFRVHDLAPVRRVLQEEKIHFLERDHAVVTAPLTGLGDSFSYVTREEMDWFTSPEYTDYEPENSDMLMLRNVNHHLLDVQGIDHIAYRTRLEEVRMAARRLMRLTAYRFDSCYTVDGQNAETMVFRWGHEKPAMVASYGWNEESVVHNYVARYGPRVHHLAFYVNKVLALVEHQQKSGIEFTTQEMIGDASRGILQIFTTPSPHSHEICEYIERFGGFRGFFDKGNVAELMGSTEKFNQ